MDGAKRCSQLFLWCAVLYMLAQGGNNLFGEVELIAYHPLTSLEFSLYVYTPNLIYTISDI